MIAALIAVLALAARTPSSVAFSHVTVVEPADGTERRDVTVLVVAERIARVGKHVRLPRGTNVVEARGKYLIPGLWDMHVHLGSLVQAKDVFPKLLALGITGLRDMGTPLDEALAIRRAISGRVLVGPELYVSGPLLNGPLPFTTPLIVNVTSPEDARNAVATLRAAGVDFLKVHDALGAPEYDAIANECKREATTFAGHVPPSITAEHAALSGQRSIEHLGGRFYGVMLACSRNEEVLTSKIRQLVARLLAEMSAGKEPDDAALFQTEFTRPLVETFDDAKAASLVALFRERRTWHCPTLVSLPLRTTAIQESDRPWANALLMKMNDLVKRIQTENGTVLAGTDAPLASPKIHDELELLVSAGLTPLQALRTATINPARYLGRTADFGSVAEGKIANMVLLDANPLDDIKNTRRIAGVVIRGSYVGVRPEASKPELSRSLLLRGIHRPDL